MSRRFAVGCALLVVASCGRIGFSVLGDAAEVATDIATDTVATAYNVLALEVGAFATSSVSFVDVPGGELAIPPSLGVRWLLLTSGWLSSSNAAGVTVEARYTVDGVEQGIGGTQNTLASQHGPWQHVHVIDGDASPQRVQYQLREAMGGQASIIYLRAVAVPLPASAVQYVRDDPPRDVTSTVASPIVELAFGSLTGDYVFLVVSNNSDAPGLTNVYTSWYGPGGMWFGETHMPREPWQSSMFIARQALDVGSATVALHARTSNMAQPARVRYVRAVAVRTDAFVDVAYARDDRVLAATTATPVSALTHTPPDVAASAYVLVASLRLSEPCPESPDAERSILFSYDLTTHGYRHTTDNCAYAATYGELRLLGSHPGTIHLSFASGNGLPVRYDGAQLLLLALP